MRWVFAIVVLLLVPSVASAHPCELRPVKRAPSPALLASLGVLRAPAGPEDRAPKEVREGDGRPYVGAMRWVPLPIGGGAWVVPLYDVSGRFDLTEACIRTMPKSMRPEMHRRKRASRGIEPLEGIELLPYGADGESHGVAQGTPDAIGAGEFVHVTGVDRERRTRVVGLVPDGVASVRVVLRDYDTGEPADVPRRGRVVPGSEVRAPVVENVFGVDIPVRLRLAVEPEVTWLDAAGAVIPRRRD